MVWDNYSSWPNSRGFRDLRKLGRTIPKPKSRVKVDLAFQACQKEIFYGACPIANGLPK